MADADFGYVGGAPTDQPHTSENPHQIQHPEPKPWTASLTSSKKHKWAEPEAKEPALQT